MDEPLAQPSHAYVCFIRGISLDAFESRWMVPIEGWRMSWDVPNGVVPGGLMAFGQNSTQLFGNPSWTSRSFWHPSVGSSLLGQPHRVSAWSSDPMDVVQGIQSWLWLGLDGTLFKRVCLGRDSSHRGNDPAVFGGWPPSLQGSYLVDPASSHMLVSKIKPCMSKYKQLYGETANGSLNQL